MVNTIIQPSTGLPIKFGRIFNPFLHPRLMFSRYISRLELPTPPASTSYFGAPDASGKAFMQNILGNDICGCCTVTAMYRYNGLMTHLAGRPIPFVTQNVLDLYKKLSGWNGVEDDPSDSGLDEHEVLRYWQTNGIIDNNGLVHKITGDMGVTPPYAKVACWLFDLYIAMALPDAWVDPMPDEPGFTWDVAGPGNPDNGHAFMAYDYNEQGLLIDTWGLVDADKPSIMTWSAVNKYMTPSQGGCMYAILTPDSFNEATQLAPSGFNFADLQADLQPGALGGVPA